MHALKSLHSSFLRWGWASALALWAAVAASRTPSAGDSAALERPPTAVLIGSSSFSQDFGHLIERELTLRGYQVSRKGVPGAGLARPDFHDMALEAEALPIDAETAAVFVYIGVNDAQALWLRSDERSDPESAWLPFASEGWNILYTRRVRTFLERMCQRGAQRAIVLLPVDVDRPELQERLLHIRELQVQAVAATTCAVAVQTAGDAGQFELAGEPTRLPDGFHMTALGARALWERIEPEVLQLLDSEPTANARSLD